MELIVNLSSGALSGWIEGMVTHPLDLIKTKTQEKQLKYNKSVKIKNIVKNIYRKNGLTGFYKGITPKLIGVIPMRLTYWGVLNNINKRLYNKNDNNIDKLLKLSFAGSISGSVQTIIDNPIEVFKTKMMTNNKDNTSKIVSDILKNKQLFNGSKMTLCRNIPFAICTNIGVYWKDTTNPVEQFLYGALGGVIGCIITQPFDYYKTDMQRYTSSNLLKKKINYKELWTGGLMRASLGFFTMGIGAVCFRQIYDYLSLHCTKF